MRNSHDDDEMRRREEGHVVVTPGDIYIEIGT